MIGTLRVLQYMLSVKMAKAMHGLFFGQLVQQGKGKNFAGAVVLSGGIIQFAISKSSGFKAVMRIYIINDFLKLELLRLGGNFLEHRGQK